MRIAITYGAIGAVALATALCGCGTSAAGVTSRASATTSPSSSPASSSALPPPTSAALQAVLVRQADLPAGWIGKPHRAGPDEKAINAGFLRCDGARDTRPDQTDFQRSPDFATPDGSSIASAATSYDSQRDATDNYVAALTNRNVSFCMGDGLRSLVAGLPVGANIESPQVVITTASGTGPINIQGTLSGSISVTLSGSRHTFYLTITLITGRMADVEVDYFGVDAPVPHAMWNSIITAVAARAAAL